MPSKILIHDLSAASRTPGLVTGMTVAIGDPTFIVKDAKQLGFYFQDDWKVSQRLTVNLGLRWDKDFNFIGGSEIANSRTFQELQAIAPFSPLAASWSQSKPTTTTRTSARASDSPMI